MSEKYKATFMMTSFPNTIERAASLISMGERITTKDQETLIGCAILLLAIALDQAITTFLKQTSEFYEYQSIIHRCRTLQISCARSSYSSNYFLLTPEIHPESPGV